MKPPNSRFAFEKCSAAAGAATAGLAGALVGLGIPEEKASRTIVTVHDKNRCDEACAALRRFRSYDYSSAA